MSNDKFFKDEFAALLDFYSDRATSYASLLVATIFGLFASLVIIPYPNRDHIHNVSIDLDFWLVLILFWFIWSFGVYLLLELLFFAERAHWISQYLTETGWYLRIKEKRWHLTWKIKDYENFLDYYFINKYKSRKWFKIIFSFYITHMKNISEKENKEFKELYIGYGEKIPRPLPTMYIAIYYIFFNLLPLIVRFNYLINWNFIVIISFPLLIIFLLDIVLNIRSFLDP